MRRSSNRTGVCLVRIETQGDGTLISVRLTPDVGQLSAERVNAFQDIESAVEAVREFLTAFADDGSGHGDGL